MARNKSRKPKTKNNPSSQRKIVASENPNSWYDKNPTWRFHRSDQNELQCKWPFNFKTFDETLFNSLIDLERRKWQEIHSDTSGRNGNTKNHFIDVERMTKNAQSRFEELNLIDIDKLYSITITGKKRLFGLLSHDGVFHILWYDLNHEVCPSKKRHT